MALSDWINAVLCVLSFILAAISVITVIITLKQNNKMIENSTRPYIVLYSNVTYFQDTKFYIILKNFGQSGAIIESFTCNIDLFKYYHSDEKKPFEHINGTFIAPQQSFMVCVNPVKLYEDKVEKINFNISYSNELKKYNEEYEINFLAYTDSYLSRASTKDKELKIISYTLQDLVEKLL